jgi:hypothetical protein
VPSVLRQAQAGKRGGEKRERPLVDFKDQRELDAWLQTQPREVAVILAVRAALRVLPLVQEALRFGFKDIDIVLPVFRALAYSWAAAKFPARANQFTLPPAGDLSAFGAVQAASNAATAAFVAVSATASRSSIDSVFHFAVRAIISPTFGIGPLEAPTSVVAFWSAASIDATRVEGGATTSVIAGSPLWPQIRADWTWALWQELEQHLLAANQDWQVWTIWYGDLLQGYNRSEERELVYVRIEEAIWNQGAAAVNAEIVRRIEELEPVESVVPLSTTSRAFLSFAEAMEPTDQAVLFAEATLPPEEAIPEQAPTATTFRIDSEGLIDVAPDPPVLEPLTDALQRVLYEETRYKAEALLQLGHNSLGDLAGPGTRFFESLPERIEEVSITRSWSRGNTLRSRLKAHDLSSTDAEPGSAHLPHDVAETLRDLIDTWNVFIFGDPKGRELDERRLGPQELDAAKQVIAAAAPIVEALQRSVGIATPRAIEAVVEQTLAAQNAPAGIEGDQALDLAQKTNRNLFSSIIRYAVYKAPGFVSRLLVEGAIRKAGADAFDFVGFKFVEFVASNYESFKGFVDSAWHNPALSHLIEIIVQHFRK